MHISQLADRFVEDPREVVKAGQIVKVKVTAIDIPRNRIALTMKLHEAIEAGGDPRKEQSQGGDSRPQQRGQQQRGAQQRGDQQRGGNQHRGGGGQGGGGQRAPRDTGQRDFGPKEAAANPFAAQLSKLNVRNN